MYHHHLVRVGVLGQIGRFTPVDRAHYPRGTEVILRTARGLEIGEVLTSDSKSVERGLTDGSILRGMTAEDRLLKSRLQKNQQSAFSICAQRVAELDLPTVLMDVELLFDGSGLYFYFLGGISPEVEAITQELAELYETQSQIRRFSEAMESGCGPGCGTEESSGGCGDSCSGCSVAAACATRAS